MTAADLQQEIKGAKIFNFAPKSLIMGDLQLQIVYFSIWSFTYTS